MIDHVRRQVRTGPWELQLIYPPRLSEPNPQGGDFNPIVPLSPCLDLWVWENVLGLEALKARARAEQLSASIGQAAKGSIRTTVLIQSHFSSTSVTVKGCKWASYTQSLIGVVQQSLLKFLITSFPGVVTSAPKISGYIICQSAQGWNSVRKKKNGPNEAQILTKLEMTFLRKEKIFLFQALEAGFK